MSETGGFDAASGPDVAWTLLDLDQLQAAYWDHVAPAMRADGLDPRADRPTYEWLSANGFRGLTYALREYHDLTFATFWNETLDLASGGYDWDVDHDPTVEAFERYLDRQASRRSWSDRTVDTHRYRLARYARAYAAANDSADLLTPVDPDSGVSAPAAVEACWSTFDALDERVSRTTLHRIYETVSDFYSTLVARREAALNPTEGLEYNWSADAEAGEDVENPPLAPEHVRALFDAAADTRERLLVVALCAWGLRASEVAALHVDQLSLSERPRIEFDERKNGPGTVALIYGADVARDRIDDLTDRGAWNGYLFPSERSASGHRTRGTVFEWFRDLADRAALPETIGGARPSPQMGRRFWYDRYSDTISQLVDEQIQEIAAEQGSASADVVWGDYLSPDRRRELRRAFMRERLADAFDTDAASVD
jgi:site-specific recombinase XerD